MMNMNARRLSKRLSTLNQEQVAYINGCNVLQRAVWRITHEDPLFCFRSQIKRYLLREAILILLISEKETTELFLNLPSLNGYKKPKQFQKIKKDSEHFLKSYF